MTITSVMIIGPLQGKFKGKTIALWVHHMHAINIDLDFQCLQPEKT